MSSSMKAELQSLIQNHAYRYSEEPFTLASGMTSHHYFNCKEITLHPERLALLCKYIVEVHFPETGIGIPEAVGGLTLGADPISYGISFLLQSKGRTVFPLIVRKTEKDHGTKKLIEGQFASLKECIVIDDVITTGGSTLQAIRALRSVGLKVERGICIIDREEGGTEKIREEGVEILPLFRKSDFKKESV